MVDSVDWNAVVIILAPDDGSLAAVIIQHNRKIGMDVHKNSIEISLAPVLFGQGCQKTGFHGRTALYRHLTAQGFDCDVVAPSMAT
jgi:hypothetical protein